MNTTIRRRTLTAALAAVLLSLSITACAPSQPSSPALTLDEAKAQTLQAEDDVIALVPAEVIEETLPRTETSSTLFNCSKPDSFIWPGGAQLRIGAATDSGAIITNIRDAFEGKAGWTTEWVEQGEKDGVFHVRLVRDDGLYLGVSNLDKNTILDIASFSPCFTMTDYDPLKSY